LREGGEVKILIVEDQLRLASFLKKSLAECSYTVQCVDTCAAALDALCQTSYDVIVLDVGLPDGSGFDLLRQWREAGFNEPILILSARDSVQDRIKGLNLGADDYLPKPFSVEELLARVRSLLRRQSGVKKTVFEHRGLRLDLLGRTVHLHDKLLDLTSREYSLLEMFIQNAGRILSRNLICEKVWDAPCEVDANLLDVYMSRLRTKLEGAAGEPFFRTVRGVGYQLQ
jgi:DNA-binding response OmpR family regulator